MRVMELRGVTRVRLDLAYDGGAFAGWACQPQLRTVQGVLEEGLERVLRLAVRLTVAGRTDEADHICKIANELKEKE